MDLLLHQIQPTKKLLITIAKYFTGSIARTISFEYINSKKKIDEGTLTIILCMSCVVLEYYASKLTKKMNATYFITKFTSFSGKSSASSRESVRIFLVSKLDAVTFPSNSELGSIISKTFALSISKMKRMLL